jgi:cytochrome c556
MNRRFLTAGLLAGVVLTGLVPARSTSAQTANQDIIVTRQAGFDLQQGAVDAIVAALKANIDIKPFAKAAEGIHAWAAQIPLVFPPGSDSGHNTKAKPEIWTDRAGFEKDAGDLAAAADKLAQLIKAGDSSGAAAQLKVVGGTCGACHRAYRVRSPG